MQRYAIALAAWLVAAAPLLSQDIPLSMILVAKEGWREVAKDFPRVTLLEAMPDGTIGICQQFLRARITIGGKVETVPVSEKVPPELKLSNRVVSRAGDLYGISQKSVTAVTGSAVPSLKLPGLIDPTCLTLWPDEGHLVIGEVDGAYLWAVRIEKDGSFGPGDRYYSLRTKPGQPLRVTAMTMDAAYLLYACTTLGVQVFDPTGRLSGVISSPAKEELTAIAIGGPKADTLYVACGDRIFARPIQGKASYTLSKKK
jgi:enterochelin esterase family protein